MPDIILGLLVGFIVGMMAVAFFYEWSDQYVVRKRTEEAEAREKFRADVREILLENGLVSKPNIVPPKR